MVGLKGGALSAYGHGVLDELPPKENMWLRVLGGLLVACVVAFLLAPVVSVETDRGGRKQTAKIGATGLTAALKAYLTEYGKWPAFTGDGLFLDEARNAQLLRTLCAKDEASNPRKIVFFEGRTADKGSGQYREGFHPETGAYLDPWGNPYRIAIDSNYDNEIANPYSDDPPIQTGVIVWSLGKDGKQGSPANPHTYKGSDDITSWQ